MNKDERFFLNDPFARVFAAFDALYPDRACSCVWTVDLCDDKDVPVYGETIFPEDCGEPLVRISAEMPVVGAVEVLAHELAHVAVGPEAGHGEAWEEAFDAIHRKYMEMIEAEKS